MIPEPSFFGHLLGQSLFFETDLERFPVEVLGEICEVVVATSFAGCLNATGLRVGLDGFALAFVVAINVQSNVFLVGLILEEFAVLFVVAVVEDGFRVLYKLVLDCFREPVKVVHSLVGFWNLKAESTGLQITSALSLSDDGHLNLPVEVPARSERLQTYISGFWTDRFS